MRAATFQAGRNHVDRPCKHPQVSIAMTTYNSERFVAAQLDSFGKQQRLPDEVVISDDASTDRTVEIVREFASQAPFPVRLLINRTNQGVVKNFERAIAESAGDIIFLSDADDYWYPQKILTMERALEETPQAGLAVCNADLVNVRLEPTGRTAWAAIDRFSPSQRLLKRIALGKTYRPGMPTGACCMAFRARFKPLVLPLPPPPGAVDYFIACAIVCSGAAGAVLLPEPLLAYRQHSGQLTYARPAPFPRRAVRRLAALRETPYLLPFIVRRLESDCARELCVNRDLRSAALRHWRARIDMPSLLASRSLVVARELSTLRYHRFSRGLLTAAKDLFGRSVPGAALWSQRSLS